MGWLMMGLAIKVDVYQWLSFCVETGIQLWKSIVSLSVDVSTLLGVALCGTKDVDVPWTIPASALMGPSSSTVSVSRR